MLILIPNLISIIRIPITYIAMQNIIDGKFKQSLCLIIIASITDILDGYSARLLNCESYIGETLDPLADKISIIFILYALWRINLVPFWFFTIMLAKDALMLIAGIIFVLNNCYIKADMLGKINTMCLFALFIFSNFCLAFSGNKINWSPSLKQILNILIAICFATTIASMVNYSRRLTNIRNIDNNSSNNHFEFTNRRKND